MMRSRRWFLQTLGAGVAVASLPEISSFLNLLSFPGGGAPESFESTIRKLLLGGESGGAFVAHAEMPVIAGTPQRLLSAPASLMGMLERLELSKGFSDDVDYSEAAQCEEQFKGHEADWRPRFNEFTDVQRAPADPDTAVMGAGVVDPNRNLREVEVAIQFQGNPALTLRGVQPGVVLAAHSLLGQESRTTSRKAAAQRLAVTRKERKTEDGISGMSYETPVSQILYVPPSSDSSRFRQRWLGAVFAWNKAEADRIYAARLYA